MASTYLSLNVHIVFATRGRAPMIGSEWICELHAYMGGTLRGLGATLIAIGGVEDHVHVLCGMKAMHCVADVVRELKKASTAWATQRYHAFGWQAGYAAFSVGYPELQTATRYIATQESHHREVSSDAELLRLLAEHGVEYDSKYFE